MDEEGLDQLSNRPGWTVGQGYAEYVPSPGGWLVRVRPYREPGGVYAKWRYEIIDPEGQPEYARVSSTLEDAANTAEVAVAYLTANPNR